MEVAWSGGLRGVTLGEPHFPPIEDGCRGRVGALRRDCPRQGGTDVQKS